MLLPWLADFLKKPETLKYIRQKRIRIYTSIMRRRDHHVIYHARASAYGTTFWLFLSQINKSRCFIQTRKHTNTKHALFVLHSLTSIRSYSVLYNTWLVLLKRFKVIQSFDRAALPALYVTAAFKSLFNLNKILFKN